MENVENYSLKAIIRKLDKTSKILIIIALIVIIHPILKTLVPPSINEDTTYVCSHWDYVTYFSLNSKNPLKIDFGAKNIGHCFTVTVSKGKMYDEHGQKIGTFKKSLGSYSVKFNDSAPWKDEFDGTYGQD